MDGKNQNGCDEDEPDLSIFAEKAEKKPQINKEIPGCKSAETVSNPA